MDKFWKWAKAEASNELIINGTIASESWLEDDVTPKLFKEELATHTGDITVRINSPGGDVFAGVSIYNMLREYNGRVVVKVDGLAASIASLIAMAGDEIVMLPGAMMMVHKPWTIAAGNADELGRAVEMLEKTCESMIPVYASRTGLSEEKIEELLAAETWMTAAEAVELGFATEAVEAKTSLSDAMKAAASYTSIVKDACLAPAMAIATRVKSEKVAEETTEEPADDTPETPVENKSGKEEENKMNEEIAKAQIIEPKEQAEVTTTPTVNDYLKTQASVRDFTQVLMANAGRTFNDVKSAWQDVLVKNNLTDKEFFKLPEPVVSAIEDAVASGEIFSKLNKTGLDVFKVTWDKADVEADTSRAGGHKKGDKKDQQVIDFESRTIRAGVIYKYLVLDKQTIRENKSTGALMKYVLNELPTRIIREVERAAVIGDGRETNDKRKITSFTSIKSDVKAKNTFGDELTIAAGMSRAEAVARAKDMIRTDGEIVLIAKKGFATSARFEKGADGKYLFQIGAKAEDVLDTATIIEPTWFTDATDPDYDAYVVVLGAYKTVGDTSVEAFTNFKLETNEEEFLQELYIGGGLSGLKSAIGLKKA